MGKDELYIGVKIIKAVVMDECSFLREHKGEDTTNRESQPGYRVTYPDGYISWSPKSTFENAYRLVTNGEKELF